MISIEKRYQHYLFNCKQGFHGWGEKEKPLTFEEFKAKHPEWVK